MWKGRSGRTAADEARYLADARFGLLLGAIVAAFLVMGISEDLWARLLAGALLALALIVAYRCAEAESRLLLAFLVVTGMASAILVGLTATATWVFAIGCGATTIACATVIVLVGRGIFRRPRVTLQSLLGAVAVYMLLGILYASLYGILDALDSGHLFGRAVEHSVYSYFSFTALTTTGFGDYTVQTDFGRRIVVIEIVSGQIFIATAIARVVTLYRRPSEEEEATDR